MKVRCVACDDLVATETDFDSAECSCGATYIHGGKAYVPKLDEDRTPVTSEPSVPRSDLPTEERALSAGFVWGRGCQPLPPGTIEIHLHIGELVTTWYSGQDVPFMAWLRGMVLTEGRRFGVALYRWTGAWQGSRTCPANYETAGDGPWFEAVRAVFDVLRHAEAPLYEREIASRTGLDSATIDRVLRVAHRVGGVVAMDAPPHRYAVAETPQIPPEKHGPVLRLRLLVEHGPFAERPQRRVRPRQLNPPWHRHTGTPSARQRAERNDAPSARRTDPAPT